MKSLREWAAVLAWMLLIFVMSAQSQLPTPESRWVDLVLEIGAHFFLYAVLAALLMRALVSTGRGDWRAFGMVVLVCGVYAVSDEFHQSFVPGRTADGLDIVVDLTGAMFGAGLGWYWSSIRRKGKSTEGI